MVVVRFGVGVSCWFFFSFVVGCCFFTLSVVGHRLLVEGCSLLSLPLVVSCWLLVVGCWLLVNRCGFLVDAC